MRKHHIDMTTVQQKRDELLRLAKRRKSHPVPPPHRNLSCFHNGYYECDHVSPWSISACNVDAELMLIGQDWASSEVLQKAPDEERRRLGQEWSSQTNQNLRGFLTQIGMQFSDTYATNVFPFIKPGKKNAPIRPADFLEKCARTYALREIEIVSPSMVICLGKLTFDAVRRAAGLPHLKWSDAGLPGPHTRIGSTKVYAMPHPGPLGIVNAGGKEKVVRRWEVLGEHLREIRNRGHCRG